MIAQLLSTVAAIDPHTVKLALVLAAVVLAADIAFITHRDLTRAAR